MVTDADEPLAAGNPHGADLDRLDSAVAGHGLTPVFQPIVSLPDGATVGFEALARWAELGDPSPSDVFARAAATGRTPQLEHRCIDAAIRCALRADLNPGATIFVNCETITPYVSRAAWPLLAQAAGKFQLVFELTERSVVAHPSDLLRKVAAVRADGFAVALDDVGAHPGSLALLDVVAPDVIKLDLAVVQSLPRYQQARTWAAVLAHHERAGAIVLAEGIETSQHLWRAFALGATLGQGFAFGRPEALSLGQRTVAGWAPPSRTHPVRFDAESPFDAVAALMPTTRERKDTVLALSRYLEQQAIDAADPPMVLAALQRTRFFAGGTRRRYHRLASAAPLVVVFGRGVAHDLGSGVRGVSLSADDVLESEWIVLTLGANVAAAVVAREVVEHGCDDVADGDRLFDVAMINDRELVTVIARYLLGRMLGQPVDDS